MIIITINSQNYILIIMEQEESLSPSSLKQKLKSSLTPSCFFHKEHDHKHQCGNLTPDGKCRHIRTSSSPWIKTRIHHDIPEFKDMCRQLISSIGVGPRHTRRHSVDLSCIGVRPRHNRRHSADFRYDVLSYALNFDEGYDDKHLDEFPLRNFSSRLPPSPKGKISEL